MTNEQAAIALSQSNPRLLNRLKEAKSVLMLSYRRYFSQWKFDFENKCLIGTDGYRLQWLLRLNPSMPESYNNQQTTRGIVTVAHA